MAKQIIVGMHEAKTHLSRYVERAAAGEEVVIARGGRPMAKLVRLDNSGPRRPGRLKGKIHIREDFDELPPELAAAFRGERP